MSRSMTRKALLLDDPSPCRMVLLYLINRILWERVKTSRKL